MSEVPLYLDIAVMKSSSKEGSYLMLVDFVSLESRPRLIKKKKKSTWTSIPASPDMSTSDTNMSPPGIEGLGFRT